MNPPAPGLDPGAWRFLRYFFHGRYRGISITAVQTYE